MKQTISSRRRARTALEKDQLKERILTAATELFINRGFSGTTIIDITKKAGVSTGTFYLYYKSKLDVYKSLQLKGLEILSAMVDETLMKPWKGVFNKLSDLALTYCRFFYERHEFFEIIAVLSAIPDELKETESEISRIINERTFILIKKIEAVIKKGMDSGEIRNLDAWRIANVYWGMMDGLILLTERHNVENVIGCSLESLIGQSLEMTFDGIRQAGKKNGGE
jgi:AcrR family transcriptional regulator